MSNNCQFKLLVLHNNNPNYIVIWLWLTFTLLMNNIQGDLQFRNCGDIRVSWYVLKGASFYRKQYSVQAVEAFLYLTALNIYSLTAQRLLNESSKYVKTFIKTENNPFPCSGCSGPHHSAALQSPGTLQIYGGFKCLEGW